jgi:cell wall-associated NlpC family hydrolase
MGQQGVNYVYGGNTPGKALDCSALVQYAFRAAGLTLPRTAAAQASNGRTIRLADIQPGDLLFYDYGGGISHVAMAIGGGKIVEASQPGHPVAVRSLYTNSLSVIKRLIG